MVSLNWRMLPNPAAKATSASGGAVVARSDPRGLRPVARASASGPAPSSARSSRVRCRGRVPEAGGQAVDALALDDAVGDEPHGARGEVVGRSQSGEPGIASGRQRLQARKPAAWAAAAVRWKLTFDSCGVRAGHTAGSRCRSCGRP